MKPEELQIGDWVKCRERDCGGHRVDYISEMDDEVGVDGEILNLNRIFPLPLTPKILEKNGFENIPYAGIDCNEIWLLHEISYYGKSFPLYTDDIMLRYSISEQCWYIFFNIGGTYSDFKTITNIFYVHELQHALRLCKIDKEIIL